MTVQELIDKLRKFDPARLVILSSDSEGNSYDTLYGIGTCSYDEKNHEIGLEMLTDKDIKLGYTEEDVLDGTPAVCLRP